MGILISVITITLLVLCYVRMYNRLKRLFVKVQEGSAGIDVALEKRYDMLSEEIEAVKKYLTHEYQIYTEVTSTRAGKELNESIFQERNNCLRKRSKRSARRLPNSKSRWKQSGSWNSSEGRIILWSGNTGDGRRRAARTSGKSGSETWLAYFRPAGTHRGQLCYQCTG
ncbi:MAG: LemA family protein [Neglectibacter timonensis]